MNVLVVLGHPRPESLGGALADAYVRGARSTGATVRVLRLAELAFDPDVVQPEPAEQFQEPGLLEARDLLSWADHLVFVYPTWWGTAPARLKGFLDRVLLPGFAFVERDDGGFAPLLGGRTAELLTTMDTPKWVYRWMYGSPGPKALARATLGFCGIETVRFTPFGPVNRSSPARRACWIAHAEGLGRRLATGPRTRFQAFRHEGGSWFKALRLHFYPVTATGYFVGALAAAGGETLHLHAFWFGLLCVGALKAATVLTNDLFDHPSDVANRNWSIFTGGSRTLVEGRLTPRAMWRGTTVALNVAGLAAAMLLLTTPGSPGVVLVVIVLFGMVALGYTLPPVKLSHRGLGEAAVALTHSLGVVLCGYVAQGGAWTDPFPWLVSLPIGLAVLPAILLAGIPDRSADAAAGKRTLVVQLGPRLTVVCALLFVGLAALAAAASLQWASVGGITRGLPAIAVPHALLLAVLLGRYLEAGAPEGRIDGLIAGSLLFILWFVAIPALNLV